MPPAKTVKQYLAALPADRRKTVEAVLDVMRKNIDKKFEEGMQYGMPAFYVPHSVYPDGYHCDPKQPVPFASVASQKNHIGLYLFCLYIDADEQARFVADWKKSVGKLDMGKSCVRVKKLEDIPLPVLGRLLKRMTCKKFLGFYEQSLADAGARRDARKKVARKKSTAKSTAKKAAKKKTTRKKVVKKASNKTATRKTTKKAAAKKVTRKKAAKKRPARSR